MARSDGTVIIDTKIDTSGFNKGTVDAKTQFDRMSSSARQTADAINSAFSRPLENAKLRVKSLERQLEGVQAKLREAMMEDDDAAAARYGAQQERVYDRLEDARRRLEMEVKAAADRQAAAEEKAAQRTEAANRKSAESARTISKETKASANNMTAMEKSARRFRNRLREIVTGAFFFNIISSALTKLTQTIWGAISSTDQMKTALSNLQGAAYTAASPLMNVLANAFTVLANAIATALSYLTQLYSLLSGKSLSALAGTAEEMGNVASAAGSAGGAADKAKKSLAGFDEITTLAAPNSGGGGGGSASTPNYDYNLDSGINPQIQALAEKIKELIAPLQKIDFTKAKKSLADLGTSFKKLGKVIGGALEWAWFKILVPLAEWVIEDAAPALIDLLAGAFEFLAEVIDAFAPIADAFWDNFLAPLAEWTGEKAVDAIEWLAEAFSDAADAIEQNSDDLTEHIIKNFEEAGTQTDANYIQPTRRDFENAAAWISEKMKESSEDIIKNFDYAAQQNDSNFVQPTRKDFENAAAWISEKFTAAKDAVVNAWKSVSGWFDTNVVQPLKSVFGGLWDVITGIFSGEVQLSGIVEKVGGYFKTLANAILKGFNNALIRAYSYINQAIGKFKNFTIGGVKPFAGLEYKAAPQVPYLAKGAVIPPNAPFAAILGDQRHGTNIEAPLSTIQEALRLELSDIIPAMISGFESVLAEQRAIRETVSGIEIGDSVIGEAVERYNEMMATARGG